MLDESRVIELAEQSLYGNGEYTGICTECGFEQDGVEPDAENYECADCGEYAVCGAEYLLVVL